MTSPKRVFLVEAMLSDHNELQGIFPDFDAMIVKLQDRVRTRRIPSICYEMVVIRVELGKVISDITGGTRSGHLIFTADGNYKLTFGRDTTLETLKAP